MKRVWVLSGNLEPHPCCGDLRVIDVLRAEEEFELLEALDVE